MSSVTILTSGAQSASGSGDAVDVSEFSTLRLDFAAKADIGMSPYITLSIDTAQAAAGPWREVWNHRMTHQNWRITSRVVLAGFDNYVRARWEGKFTNLTLGLTGDGKPDAE